LTVTSELGRLRWPSIQSPLDSTQGPLGMALELLGVWESLDAGARGTGLAVGLHHQRRWNAIITLPVPIICPGWPDDTRHSDTLPSRSDPGPRTCHHLRVPKLPVQYTVATQPLHNKTASCRTASTTFSSPSVAAPRNSPDCQNDRPSHVSWLL
jgi:hypothetical protein